MDDILFTYALKVKLNDYGTPFSIKFNEGPDEFDFSTCKCNFFAKHQTIPDKHFTGDCIIDIANKIATYFTVAGDNDQLGSYKFEFKFAKGSAGGPIYNLTYPADKVLTYLVVENFEA